MEQFTEEFLAFRDRMEAALPEAFKERERGVMIAGRGCALAAGYSLSCERKMFGMIGTGSHTHSHELRLLFSAPGLTAEDAVGWREYAQAALKERIKLDRAHEFTILSIILATDGMSRDVIKTLKKSDEEERYEKPGAGWSQIRFVAADLEKRKLYPSPLGKPLADLMKGLL